MRWPEFEWSIHPLHQSHKRVSQPRPKPKRRKLDGTPVPVPPSAPRKGSWLEIPPTTHMQPRALFAGPEEQLTVDEDPDLDIADATLLEHQNRILTKANIGLERRLEMERQRVKQLLQESRHTTQSSAWAPPPSVQEVTLSSATPPPPKPKFSPIRNPSMFLLDFVESL